MEENQQQYITYMPTAADLDAAYQAWNFDQKFEEDAALVEHDRRSRFVELAKSVKRSEVRTRIREEAYKFLMDDDASLADVFHMVFITGIMYGVRMAEQAPESTTRTGPGIDH